MKKIIICIIVLIVLFSFTACNQNVTLGNFNYKGAHIQIGDSVADVSVKSWHDDQVGTELHLNDGNNIFCSEGTYILYEKDCPICSTDK